MSVKRYTTGIGSLYHHQANLNAQDKPLQVLQAWDISIMGYETDLEGGPDERELVEGRGESDERTGVRVM